MKCDQSNYNMLKLCFAEQMPPWGVPGPPEGRKGGVELNGGGVLNGNSLWCAPASLAAQMVKTVSAMQETWVQFLG